MAGEIGHVIYAARLLTYLGDAVQQPTYWAGTLFPNIRHLGITSRHRTHPTHVTLRTLVGKTDFQTGMRVHAWLDATRQAFLEEANTKESLPWHPLVPYAYSLLEDELLYPHFDDWNLIQRMLNKLYDDELLYVSVREQVGRWHTVLQHYITERPSDDTRRHFVLAHGMSEAAASELNHVVALLRRDPRTLRLHNRFLHHLEHVLA